MEETIVECARRHFKTISDNSYINDIAKDNKNLYDIVRSNLLKFVLIYMILFNKLII